MTDRLRKFLTEVQQRVNNGLEKYLPAETEYPQSVHKSMRYSIFAGGKRIRPALAIAAYDLFDGKADSESILYACCSLEMLHVFSLIHDDLPAMDDDEFRRGKPTNHRVFGEATAILGGDALCIHAFELLGRTGNCRVIIELGKALGTNGMIGGQVVDIESEDKDVGTEVLEYIHTHKTGALIATSVRIGALLADVSEKDLNTLTRYGRNIGLAFQVADDILDVVGSTKQIGKDAGSDQAKGKVTYPSVFGLEKSKQIARELAAHAREALVSFGSKADILRDASDYIVERVK